MREVNFTANTRQELYDKLSESNYNCDNDICSEYALVSYNEDGKDFTVPMYFMGYDGAFFESPCDLYKTEFTGDAKEYIESYVKDLYEFDEVFTLEKIVGYEMSLVRGNTHYEIENFQCSPFLPMPCKVLCFMNDSEVLDYILEHQPED